MAQAEVDHGYADRDDRCSQAVMAVRALPGDFQLRNKAGSVGAGAVASVPALFLTVTAGALPGGERPGRNRTMASPIIACGLGADAFAQVGVPCGRRPASDRAAGVRFGAARVHCPGRSGRRAAGYCQQLPCRKRFARAPLRPGGFARRVTAMASGREARPGVASVNGPLLGPSVNKAGIRSGFPGLGRRAGWLVTKLVTVRSERW
jgi:hypothetical protein